MLQHETNTFPCVGQGDSEVFGFIRNVLLSLRNVWSKSGVNNGKVHIDSKASVHVGHQPESSSHPKHIGITDLLTCSRLEHSVLLKGSRFERPNLQLLEDLVYQMTLSPV